MKKISTVFVINRETNLATAEILKGNEWVVNGEGIATVKFDGSSCLIKDGILFRRWNRKLTKKAMKAKSLANRKGEEFIPDESMFRSVPEGAILCNETFDPKTLHWPHWIPVTDDAADKLHLEAFEALKAENKVSDGTWEICGPKIRCNPHNFKTHVLIKHGEVEVKVEDRSFNGIKTFLESFDGEGLVFHHADGRMAKIRNKDFELSHKWNEDADPRDKK
jgi:hypothetical protein